MYKRQVELLEVMPDEDIGRTRVASTERLKSAQHILAVRRCLLYTSDAADERSSVDLGGRRIIKKKTSRGWPMRQG